MQVHRKRAIQALLWALIIVWGVLALLPVVAPGSLPPVLMCGLPVMTSFAFCIIHGSARYGWKGLTFFLVVCLLVSNVFENLSIITGFPFGHYHYSDALGMKLFLVPLLIGPAYFGTGYLAWTVANLLLGEPDRKTDVLSVVALPVLASFLMVGWDVCLDPTMSTVQKLWIWHDGGGYFGVPFSNYLGWFLTVFIFYQLFALYLARRQSAVITEQPKAYWYQAAAFFGVIGLKFFIDLGLHNVAVTDAAGHIWRSGDIYETAAIISLYTMIAAAIAGLLVTARREAS